MTLSSGCWCCDMVAGWASLMAADVPFSNFIRHIKLDRCYNFS
jgi:hypothetical protein